MKKLLTILLLIFTCTFVKAQKETAWFVELFLGFSNCPQPNSYTFQIDKVSTVWAANDNFNPPGFFINEDPEIDNSIYPWYIQNSIVGGDWKGWNMVYSQDQYTINDTATPVYGYGLYKISTNASNSHFYIDYRDNRIPYSNVTHIGHAVDHWVKYDFNNNKFYISPISHTSSYTEISNGDLIRFWELKQTNPALPSTSGFPDYWENCLAIIPDENNHPTFIFGPYPDNLQGTITGYKIYRSAAHIPGQQPSNFTLLETLESDEYIYTDNTVTIGNDYNARSYYVTCIYEDPWESSGETNPTNTVEVRLQIPQKIAAPEYITDQKNDCQLNQNYPNPFNPLTIISYSIREDSYVTLKVYDILGTLVADLVNERKEAGNYQIPFNASNLSSGLYFYILKANGFSFTKKMILTK